MNNEFITAVLEGVENTLEELTGRVHAGEARDQLGVLIEQTAAVRRSCEERVSVVSD
jgi:hypothetical protein